MKNKWKCYTALLMAATMVTSSPHMVSFAVEQRVEASNLKVLANKTVEQKVSLADVDLPSNDELFKGYVDQLFYGKRGISFFGNYGDKKLQGYQKAIYDYLKGQIKEIAEGRRESTVVEVPLEAIGLKDGLITAEDLGIDYVYDSNTGQWNPGLNDAIINKIAGVEQLMKCLLVDCPYELYWFKKDAKGAMGVDGIRYSAKQGENGDYVLWFSENLVYSFIVADAYKKENNSYVVNSTKVQAATRALENAKALVKRIQSQPLTPYGQMMMMKEEICKLVSYNYDAAANKLPYGDPWQMIYVFDGDPSTNVVCEGYAKAFQYLCDMVGLDCYTVTGMMKNDKESAPGENHMWNIVTLGGKNYLVDITNSDDSTAGSEGGLFVAHGSGSIMNDYLFDIPGQGKLRFSYFREGESVSDSINLYGSGADSILNIASEAYKEPGYRQNVNITMKDWTYGDRASTPTYSGCVESGEQPSKIEYKKATDDATAYRTKVPTEAGTYTVRVTFPETSKWTAGTFTKDFTIRQKSLTNAMVSVANGTHTYTGTAITPAVTVKDGQKSLVLDKDYANVSYQNNTNAGTATVTVTGKGNYTGTASAQFTIDKAQGVASVTMAGWTYGGQKSNPVAVSSNYDTNNVTYYYKLKGANDSTYVTTKPDAAGTYVVKAVFGATNNYKEIARTAEFTIAKADASLRVASVPAKKYGDTPFQLQVTKVGEANVTYSSNNEQVATVAPDGTVTIKGVGDATITARMAASNNYNATSTTVNIHVNKGVGRATVQMADWTYGDTAAKPVPTSETNGTKNVVYSYKLVGGTEYTATVPTDAGTYVVRATFPATDRYEQVVVEDTFTINKKELAAEHVTISKDSWEQTGQAIEPEVTVKVGTQVLRAGVDYKVRYEDNVVPGIGKVIVTGNGNYAGSIEKTFTILEQDKYPEIQKMPTMRGEYGTTASAMLQMDGVAVDKKTKETIEGTWAVVENGQATPSVGTTEQWSVVFTPENTEKYSPASVKVTPVVTKKKVKVAIKDATRVYKEANPTFALDIPAGVLVGADTKEDLAVTFATEAVIDSNVGSYAITGTSTSQNYEVTVTPGTLTITKANGTGKVSMANWAFNGTASEPVLESATNGIEGALIQYKAKNAKEFTNEKPTAVGEYIVKATFPANNNYKEVVVTNEFRIEKADGRGTVTMEGWTYKETAKNPVATSETNKDATVTYQYKLKDAADSTYSNTKPTDAGTYTVKATFAATENYKEVVAYADFTIAKANGSGTVAMEGWTYKGTAKNPVATSETNKNALVTYQYKLKDAADSTYSSAKPTDAGTYTVKATFAATKNYKEVVAFADFTIAKADGAGKVSMANWAFNGTASEPVLESATNGIDGVLIQYKAKNAKDFTNEKPTAVGEYIVKATFPANNNYKEVVATNEFRIEKGNGQATVSLEGWTYKETAKNPVATSETNKDATVTYQYKLKDAADSTYSNTKPTDAGTYTVKATFAATENYKEAVAYADFTIAKANGSGTVAMEGWTYKGTAKNPVATSETNKNALVTYQYKLKDAADSTYSSAKPTDAGTYTVKATFAATKNYKEVVAFAEFTINKAAAAIDIQAVDAKKFGDAPFKLNVTKTGEAAVTYVSSNPDVVTVATDGTVTIKGAGEAEITASMAESKNYLAAEKKVTIRVNKGEGQATVTMADWTYKETASEPVATSETNKGAAVTIQYKAKDASEYTDQKPEDAGEYTVKVTFAATANYEAVTKTANFQIRKADGQATVSLEGWTYKEAAKTPVATSETNKDAAVTYQYKLKGSEDSTYSDQVPTDAGTYIVKATFAATKNYKKAVAESEFVIAKADGSGTVAMADWTYGDKAGAPVATSDTNGTNHVTYMYKVKGADDSTYSKDVPTNAGTYTVKAKFAATKNYKEVVAVTDFTIAKAEKPEQPKDTVLKVEAADSLSKVTPPDGWKWTEASKDKELVVGGCTEVEMESTDLDNYENVTTVKMEVRVLPTFLSSNESYVLGKNQQFVLKTNGEMKVLKEVYVDGKKLSAEAYSLQSETGARTVLTIAQNYMDQLKAGKHTVQLVYEAGAVEQNFEVKDETKAPAPQQNTDKPADKNPEQKPDKQNAVETADTTPNSVWYMISLAAASFVALFTRKKRDDKE